MDLTILQGDCREKLRELPDGSVHCCVTSPPYFGLRDYGVDGQIGIESSPDEFVAGLVDVFREVRRALRDDGTLWINLGDSYAAGGKGGGGSYMAERREGAWQKRSKLNGWRSAPSGMKTKDLIGIPWMVAFALRADGWYLRQDIIWSKPNPMPESVTDRCTKAHEYLFLLSKSPTYYYDQEAIKEPVVGDPMAVRNRWDTKDYLIPGQKPQKRLSRQRKPAGWDKGEGGHGSFHRNGRAEEVEYTERVSDRRNKRSIWTVPTFAFPDAHFATYPPELIKPCILAGCPAGGVVLDPFGGSGTTGKVALELGRSAMLIELNPEYVKLIEKRCRVNLPLMFEELEA